MRPGGNMFYIGFNNEGFISAKEVTIVPASTIEEAIDYATPDLGKRIIDSFQIYNESGVLVHATDSEVGVA